MIDHRSYMHNYEKIVVKKALKNKNQACKGFELMTSLLRYRYSALQTELLSHLGGGYF